MLIVPVMDLKQGHVVRAVAGQRDAYAPLIHSHGSTFDLAAAMLAKTGSDALYIADLDHVLGSGTNETIWLDLAERLEVDLFVDVGIRTSDDLKNFPDHPRLIPILGTETMIGPETALAAKSCDRATAISIDLRGGTLLGPWQAWEKFGVHTDKDVAALTHAATTLSDAATVIVLDLAGVGMGQGPLAEVHIPAIRQAMRWRTGELWVGGGIRHQADVERLQNLGASGVLVSSSLHNNTLELHEPYTRARQSKQEETS